MKKIKVVHIVPMLSPGGAERVMLHIVSGLNRQRYEPVVVSLMGRMECDLDRLLDDAGVKVLYLGKHLGFDYRIYLRLYRALQECRPDVVHTHLQVLRYVFPCLKLFKQVAALHTVHNLAEREIESRMRWFQGYALKHGVMPVAVAEEVALSLQRTYGIPKCRVIPNCIPTESYACPKTPRREWRAREGFAENDVLFASVARFAAQKNHTLLLKAFAEGPAANRRAHLVLIGDGVLRRHLETQSNDLGLAGQVHFLGVRADIPDALGAMDVFALSSDFEGNPLSVMEAMASGLPIVSTAVGGVPDVFESGRHGLQVHAGDLHGLSECMTYLLKNREARKSFGLAAARRAREKFDVSKMVHAYEELYEELVDASHPMKIESLHRKSTLSAEEAEGDKNALVEVNARSVASDSPKDVLSPLCDLRTAEPRAKYRYCFTVFTPTYNRSHTLSRVYESLRVQSFRDFEWLVVDDGSTDGTREVVEKWQRGSSFPIHYVYQENQGKPAAFNRGVQEAQGELFLTLDSDDACIPQALERFKYHWDSIPSSEKHKFSAITALCKDEDGRLVGDKFPRDVLDSDSIELYFKYRVKGEKWGFHRTEILKQFPFLTAQNAKFISEGVVWFAISRRFKTRFINEVLRIYYVNDEGGDRLSSLSPAVLSGRSFFHKFILNEFGDWCFSAPAIMLRSAANFSRYSFGTGKGPYCQLRELGSPMARLLVAVSMPLGLAMSLKDSASGLLSKTS